MLKLRLKPIALACVAFLVLAACAGNPAVRTAPTAAAQSAATAGQSRNATPAQADSAWQAGAYPLATEMYEGILARDPSSHIAMFRLATLRSWDNRFDEAIALFRRYVAVEPNYSEGRLALARVIAWSGDFSSSLAIYDSVLTREPNNRDAVLGRAQTLAWANRFDAALAIYKKWTAAHPTDRDARMDYARTLAWNGQLGDAESMYAELSRTGSASATKGLARVIGWRGDFQRSEETWRRVLVTDPSDAEALTGLAQILSWQGRQSDAELALQAALRANPAYGDARSLLRLVEADLRPSVTVSAIGSDDSDHNRATSFILDYLTAAPWSGSLGAKYTERWTNFAAIDSRADAGSIVARWQPASTSGLRRAEGGASQPPSNFTRAGGSSRTIASGSLSATG